MLIDPTSLFLGIALGLAMGRAIARSNSAKKIGYLSRDNKAVLTAATVRTA